MLAYYDGVNSTSLLIPFVLVLAILLLPISSARADWYQYQNSRYGFVVDVPSDLVAGEPPANGDGQEWKSRDGSLEVIAFARLANLETGHEFRQMADQTKAEARQENSYFKEGDVWFVHSWTDGDAIRYQRVLLQESCQSEVIAVLLIDYPKSLKEDLDPVVTRISSSFKFEGCGWYE